MLETLLQAIAADPADHMAWLALADCLEEEGQPEQAEFARLREGLRTAPPGEERLAQETRLQEMLLGGLRPVMPTLHLEQGISLVLIPPGQFLMGSPETEPDRWGDEGPRHLVTLTQGFWLGTHPITQKQWQHWMKSAPSKFKGDDHPVDSVSWNECRDFCKKLGKQVGRRVRLPSEAEWEYACRACTTSPFHFGMTISTNWANYDGNIVYASGERGEYRRQTVPVGSFPCNAWGLYDMHGNIRDWCQDGKRGYSGEGVTDPMHNVASASSRSVRGGSWYNVPWFCRAACRLTEGKDLKDSMIGFRVLVELG